MWNEALISRGKRDVQWSSRVKVKREDEAGRKKDKHTAWMVLRQRDNNHQSKSAAALSNNLQA